MSEWNPDPLLSARGKVPHFLRTQWDEATARSFGPWRVAAPVDPTDAQTVTALPPELPDHTVQTAEQADAPAVDSLPSAEPPNTWSDSAMAAMREQARQQGIAEGLQQAREEWEAERHKEKEVLRHLGIELRSLQQDPQRFFEPLKRLALHIAEQWVRGELQVSGRVVEQLVRQCLAELDPNGQKVQVELSPDDLQRLKALGEEACAGLELQADPQLRDGSVRVRINESVVQDLIEHRLEAMARQLLKEPDAWLQQSALLHPSQAVPVDESDSLRQWPRRTVDVEDATPKSAAPQDQRPPSEDA